MDMREKLSHVEENIYLFSHQESSFPVSKTPGSQMTKLSINLPGVKDTEESNFLESTRPGTGRKALFSLKIV